MSTKDTSGTIKSGEDRPTPDYSLSMRLATGLPALALITIATIVVIHYIGSQRMHALVVDAGSWGPVVFILLKVLTFVVAPLSGAPLKILAGTLFGFWHGVAYSTIGDALGATLNFWLARLFGWKLLNWFFRQKSLASIHDITHRVGTWRTLLWARLFLTPIYDFVSYAVGLTDVPYPQFLLITYLGAFIPAAFFAWIGVSATHSSHLLNLLYLSLGVATAIVAMFVWLARRARRARRENPPAEMRVSDSPQGDELTKSSGDDGA